MAGNDDDSEGDISEKLTLDTEASERDREVSC